MPFAKNGEIEIHYHAQGTGYPLILVHGFMGDISSWYKLGYIDRLSEDYMVIAIDARGHGRSGTPYEPTAYRDRTMATDVISVMDDLGIEDAFYYGFSMGGRIGFELAAFYEDRFKAFILGAQTPGGRTDSGTIADKKRLSLFQKDKSVFLKVLRRSGPEFDSYMDGAVNGDIKAFTAKTRANAFREDISDLLTDLSTPCLLYAGEKDTLAHDSLRENAIKIPSATFVEFPGLNHMQSVSQSELIIPTILDFLDPITDR